LTCQEPDPDTRRGVTRRGRLRTVEVEKARITSHPSEVPIFNAPGALGNQGGGARKMTRYVWGQ